MFTLSAQAAQGTGSDTCNSVVSFPVRTDLQFPAEIGFSAELLIWDAAVFQFTCCGSLSQELLINYQIRPTDV